MLRYFLQQVKANRGQGTSLGQLKYFSRWKRSLRPTASSVKDEQPWITYDAIELLENLLNKESKVFEYGGGGSTLFFAQRVKELVTVEHDKKWFDALSSIVANKNIKNWKGNYIEPQQDNLVADPDTSNPDHYSSEDLQSKGFHFRNYAGVIDSYTDNYFDAVLVDGRSRPSCIKHAIPKIKKGGYLIVDNSDRSYYLPFFKSTLDKDFSLLLDKTGPTPYCREFTRTSIWRKN